MDQMIIRHAVEGDIPTICRLQNEWFEEDCVHGYQQGSAEQVRAGLGHFCLVAELQGCVIGYISSSIHSSAGTAVIPAGEQYIEVDDLYVSKFHRGHGAGGQLLDELLAEAKRHRLTYALLYSATKDIHSILQFYEHHGFESWYIQMFRSLA